MYVNLFMSIGVIWPLNGIFSYSYAVTTLQIDVLDNSLNSMLLQYLMLYSIICNMLNLRQVSAVIFFVHFHSCFHYRACNHTKLPIYPTTV